VPTVFEYHYPPWQRWFIVRVFPGSDGGVSVHLTDTTDVHALQADVQASTALALDHLRKLVVLRTCGPDSKLVEVPGLSLKDLTTDERLSGGGTSAARSVRYRAWPAASKRYRRILATGIGLRRKWRDSRQRTRW
jgi:hypothetical protein